MNSRSFFVIGVSMTPGATAFRRMPAPIHSAVGACWRTHRASASFDAGYANNPGAASTAASAAGSSPARIDVDERVRQARRGRRRVGADRDGGRVGAAGEQRPEPVERCDRAEVVDRNDRAALPHDTRGRDQHRRACRRTRYGTASTIASRPGGRREVGDHLGVAHVDTDARGSLPSRAAREWRCRCRPPSP